jgi:hypothetical protein
LNRLASRPGDRAELWLLAAAVTAVLVTLAPTRAQACGGTFCDAGPTPMPVDQSGENILFWIDQNAGDPHTEAHIQIQYEGDPDQFAWVVPVLSVPEVLVGSQALFDNVLAGTVPIINVTTRVDGDCAFASFGCVSDRDSGFAGGDGGDFADETGGDSFGEDGPEILDRGFAGAFEYVVLTAETVDVIVDWLDEAGYQQDPDAPPILAEYLQEGFVFVAFKLRGGTGVDEIHPIAIRYAGVEPCIPIRLTRIAATEDMAIRAFFLGHDRVVPQNWPHVLLNWVKFDWVGWSVFGADIYEELVSAAIDEAGGRAFITEYAGTDAVVATVGIANNLWDSAAFVDIEPTAVVDTLEQQQLMTCEINGTDVECQFSHPQVRPLLERYLPAPENVPVEQFWECLECYAGLIDPVAWQAQPGFAAEFEQRITGPATHALDMLVDSTYLTRLYTLISPHEMLEDPLFHETSALGNVDSAITATQVNTCDDGPSYIELTDGRKIALGQFNSYPEFGEMPSAEQIERVPMMGAPQVETDNRAAIDDLVEQHNFDHLVGPSPSCSLARMRPEGMLTMLVLFGLAWSQRSPRSRSRRRS